MGAVADAVANLQTGRSAGKVAVRLAAPSPVVQQVKLVMLRMMSPRLYAVFLCSGVPGTWYQ